MWPEREDVFIWVCVCISVWLCVCVRKWVYMCLCVYICIYVFMYVYVCMCYMCVCVYICVYVSVCICMCVHMCMCIYVCMCINVYVYVFVYVRICVYVCVYMYVFVCTCICGISVCIYVWMCICVCVYMWCICICLCVCMCVYVYVVCVFWERGHCDSPCWSQALYYNWSFRSLSIPEIFCPIQVVDYPGWIDSYLREKWSLYFLSKLLRYRDCIGFRGSLLGHLGCYVSYPGQKDDSGSILLTSSQRRPLTAPVLWGRSPGSKSSKFMDI